MSQHTPGPWQTTKHQRASLAEASIEVASAGGRPICDMGDYPNEEDGANARLIAKAPEMYALLQAFVDMYPPDNHFSGTFDKARALLLEIEGE